MNQYNIIFIGKSGSGKGTQIKALFDSFKEKGVLEDDILYLEAGQNLRDMIATGTPTGKLAQAVNTQGMLQPAFLAIWAWSNKLISLFRNQKIIIVDGAPRKANEAYIIDEMLDFYGRENRFVIHLDVSDEWAREKLAGRGREDDLRQESVDNRLAWFKEHTPKIMRMIADSENRYKLVTINGEQSIEAVHADVLKELGL